MIQDSGFLKLLYKSWDATVWNQNLYFLQETLDVFGFSFGLKLYKA
jgi:hypothetical protein